MRRRPIRTCRRLLYKPVLTSTGEPKSEEDADARRESTNARRKEMKPMVLTHWFGGKRDME